MILINVSYLNNSFFIYTILDFLNYSLFYILIRGCIS